MRQSDFSENSSISLLIDCRWIRYSGVGTCIINVIKELSLRQNIKMTLLCLYSDEDIISNFSFSPAVIWTNIKSMTLAEQFVLPFRLKGHFDYFYAPVYIRPLFHPGKLICTVHDILHVSRPRYTSNRLISIYAYILIASTLILAEHITVDTHFTKTEILRFFPWARNTRLRVLYPGFKRIYSESIRPHNTFSRSLSEFEKPYFLFVGNLKPHKNLDTLIQAFLKSNSCRTHQLRVVGKYDGLITSSVSSHMQNAKGAVQYLVP